MLGYTYNSIVFLRALAFECAADPRETEQEGGRKDNASERAESRDQSQYLLGEQIASKADSRYPLS